MHEPHMSNNLVRTSPFCRIPVKSGFPCESIRANGFARMEILRGRHGGVEKRGGWKTSRMTPLPKRGFGPPHPPQCQCSVSGECILWYVFLPPYVLHPPISRPKNSSHLGIAARLRSGELPGASGLLLKSTARAVPGKSPKNFWESLGKFW